MRSRFNFEEELIAESSIVSRRDVIVVKTTPRIQDQDSYYIVVVDQKVERISWHKCFLYSLL